MSTNIDERVVAMKFNNGQFQNGVANSLKSLDSLKKGLNLDGAKKGLDELSKAGNRFSLGSIGTAAEGISTKFVALATIGITALSRIANSAINAGTTLIKSLTIDPITSGLREYETNLNSIQTILANTQSKGTNLDQVKVALQELNTYSDKTIYNFSEMARNIGTFTAAGVDLDTSVMAIKGIANLAALSGSNSQQAATAMYQLSQALSTGSVKLMDWNSVVNAGMGGQVFQDAIKETARASGVAVDDIIAKNGSFRNSLQEGWLTSDILTKTLAKLTGDMNAEQLKAQGYTDEQIISIMKLAKTASDAATKVKTATQLIGTLQESVGSGWGTTFRLILGDFDEAPKLFTAVNDAIGSMISAQADARNKLVTDWRGSGGRDSAIQAVANAFHAVMAILKPLKAALTSIFPPATGAQLASITKAIEAFTKGLILSEEAQNNLKRTAKGVFAVFDILFFIVGKIVGVFFDLFGAATKGGTGILGITGNVGDFLVKIRDAIKNGEGLNKFFEGLKTVLRVPITLIRSLIGFFVDLGKGMSGIDASGITDIFDRIVEHLKPLTNIGSGIEFVFQNIGKALKKVADFFSPIAEVIGGAASQLGSAIKSFMGDGNFNTILDVVNVGLLGGLVLLVKKFIDTITKKFKGFGAGGGIISSIKGIFGQLTDTLSAMQGQLKAKTLILIAGAIALLTVSVVALSMIDSGKLASALTGLTVMFGQLIGAMAILDKIQLSKGLAKLPVIVGSMILLAIAIDLLAIAVAKLSALNFGDLMKGLLGAAVAMGIMVAATQLISKGGPRMVFAGVAMIAFAVAINILASAVSKLGDMDMGTLIKGMGSVAVIMGLIIGFTRLVGNPALLISTSIGLVILAAALNVMADAVAKLGAMSVKELVKGLSAMGLALAIVTVAVNSLPATLPLTAVGLVIVASAINILAKALASLGGMSVAEIAKGLIAMGGALLILAVGLNLMSGTLVASIALTIAASALLILASAIKEMGSISWDEFGKSMAVLGSSLAILAIAMYLMTGSLPGAAALIIAAAAIMILAPAVLLLGTMSWDEIGRGMAVLASALAILAIAGVLLIPALPGLLGLGAAILLLGLGALAAGIGISMLAVGLTALAVAGGAGIAVLTAAVSALASLIPFIATQIGLGIIAIAVVIGENGPAILGALTAILLALIAAIVAIIPPLIDAAVLLVTKLVEAIVILVPLLVDAGLRLIIGILDGFANNIGKIVEKGTDVVVALLDGIGKAIPRLMQAGVDLVLDFINGLADTIRNNTQKFNDAGNNLADAIIDGLTSGVRNGVNNVIKAITGVANGAINAAKRFLGIASPSKIFTEIGEFTMEGMAIGITNLKSAVVGAAVDVGDSAVSAVSKSISGMSAALSNNIDIQPSIRPVLDLSAIKKDGSLIAGMLGIPTLSLDGVRSNVSSASAGYEQNIRIITDSDGEATGEPGTTINYTQNNNSPKALSAVEIYRQTKNQLSVAKGELDK